MGLSENPEDEPKLGVVGELLRDVNLGAVAELLDDVRRGARKASWFGLQCASLSRSGVRDDMALCLFQLSFSFVV